jgi:hypothetical protein
VPSEETGAGAQACADNVDNDQDGLFDCADPDCARTPQCGAPVPLLSPHKGLVLVVLLCLVGLFGLAGWQRGT